MKPVTPYFTSRFGQVSLTLVPVRAEASHRSEMTTQALFGEVAEILERKKEWLYIRLKQDAYEGWVEAVQLRHISESEYQSQAYNRFAAEDTLVDTGDMPLYILTGSPLPPGDEKDTLRIGDKHIRFPGEIIRGKKPAGEIIRKAMAFLNTPYLWGGKTHFGMDCSGLTQLVYTMCGYPLKRDASQQVRQGEWVSFTAQIKAGDLAFFGDDDAITHVGIALENRQILHAALGRVRIDMLDDEGIYNRELQRYTHHLRVIKRMVVD